MDGADKPRVEAVRPEGSKGPAAAEKLGCSRLAGDPVCRCGGSPMGRYCLWSYYRGAVPGCPDAAKH